MVSAPPGVDSSSQYFSTTEEDSSLLQLCFQHWRTLTAPGLLLFQHHSLQTDPDTELLQHKALPSECPPRQLAILPKECTKILFNPMGLLSFLLLSCKEVDHYLQKCIHPHFEGDWYTLKQSSMLKSSKGWSNDTEGARIYRQGQTLPTNAALEPEISMHSKQIRGFSQRASKACLSQACGRTQRHGKLQTAARARRILAHVEKQDEERQIYIGEHMQGNGREDGNTMRKEREGKAEIVRKGGRKAKMRRAIVRTGENGLQQTRQKTL